MDVNKTGNSEYNTHTPPPMPGSGEFAPVPMHHAMQEAPAPPPEPAPNMAEIRAERLERTESLSRAVSELNSSLSIYRRHLAIRMHQPTNRRIVTVYDTDTNEAIREIPAERVLEAHASMLEMAGLLLDTRG